MLFVVVKHKLFVPMAILTGVFLLGCLALVFTWLYMRDKEVAAAEQLQKEADAAVRAAAMGSGPGADGAAPGVSDPLLPMDEQARASLASSFGHRATQPVAAAPAVAAVSSAPASAAAIRASDDDRQALLNGSSPSGTKHSPSRCLSLPPSHVRRSSVVVPVT
jgi:hypothetical protein